MTDPKRLHEMDLDLRTHRIIAAGLDDVPLHERVDKIAMGIASGAVVLGTKVAAAEAAGGAAAAPLISAALIAKWLSVGALSGLVVGLGIAELDGMARPAPEAAGARISRDHRAAVPPGPASPLEVSEKPEARLGAPAQTPVAAQKSITPSDALPATAGSSKIPLAPNVEPPLVSAVNGPAVAFPPAPAHDASALREEVALIARAKALLDRGAAAEALSVSSTYRSRFPHGRLEPEASAIELEANVALGMRAQATAIARRLAAGTGPGAVRARQLLEGGL